MMKTTRFRQALRRSRLAMVGLLSILATAQPGLNAATCYVDGGAYKQTIDGFGFSTAWYSNLNSAQGDVLFGTGAGQLGFSLLRCRIAFDRQWATEKNNATVAHNRGAKVLGTAWTPPPSMKDNNHYVGGNLLVSQYRNYAIYLRDAATNIGLDYVSFQNEPDITVTYESCHWTPEQMRGFCYYDAPTIGKPVVMPESFKFNDAYSDPTLNDATAVKNIAIVGGHLYGAGNYVRQNAINKGKRVWQTEHYFTGTSIGTCMSIAKEVSDCMNNQFNAYFWWWIKEGDGASFITGTTPLKNGYTLAQFAKYIRPGKVRIGTTYNPSSNVYVTAYRNGGVVIVAVNTGSSSVNQQFTLQNISGVTSLIPVRTSASDNLSQKASVTVSNNSFTYALPAQSVTTFRQF